MVKVLMMVTALVHSHTWQDCRVDFFGQSWRVIGLPQQGIDENIPGAWNQKWMVERYE